MVFRCRVTAGTEPVTLVWNKIGGQLPFTALEIDGILELNNVQPEDAGSYQCVGTNSAGSSQARGDLDVRSIGRSICPADTSHDGQVKSLVLVCLKCTPHECPISVRKTIQYI